VTRILTAPHPAPHPTLPAKLQHMSAFLTTTKPGEIVLGLVLLFGIVMLAMHARTSSR
jgi:hypothetical protein